MNLDHRFSVNDVSYEWALSADRELMFYAVGNPVALGVMSREDAADAWDVEDVIAVNDLHNARNAIAVVRAAAASIGAWIKSARPANFWFRADDRRMRVYESLILRDPDLLADYDMMEAGDARYFSAA